jgi:LysM repeat protein
MECPTFRTARTARAATLILSGDPVTVEAIDAARRPIARTAPILLEEPRLVDQAVRLRFDRGPGQLALVGLMILAFTVVAITRLSAGSVPGANGSAAPSGLADASSSSAPTAEATPSSSPEASPSAVVASAEPSFRTTYTVKKGDTLTTIASRFKTTAIAIRRLNQLSNSTIHTGQVLKIP